MRTTRRLPSRGRCILPFLFVLAVLVGGCLLFSSGLPVDEGPFPSIWEGASVGRAHEKLVKADRDATNAAMQMRMMGLNPYTDLKMFTTGILLRQALMDMDRALVRAHGPSLFAPRVARLKFERDRLRARVDVIDRLVQITTDDDYPSLVDLFKLRFQLIARIAKIEKELNPATDDGG